MYNETQNTIGSTDKQLRIDEMGAELGEKLYGFAEEIRSLAVVMRKITENINRLA
jgi:hypothetical protein